MKLSRTCLYALRGLNYLARYGRGGAVASDAIAEAEGLSAGFLGKAMGKLASARLLSPERGPRGGYRLARPARSITLLEVVEAVDGPVRGEAPAVGENLRLRAELQQVRDEAAEAVRGRLGKVSLADLAGAGEG